MFQFTTFTIPLGNHLTKDNAKTGKELSDKVVELIAEQGDLLAEQEKASSLPLTEWVDTSGLNRAYHGLLVKELALRNEFAQWLPLDRKDKESKITKAFAEWDKLKLSLNKKLIELGWENLPATLAFCNSHFKVRELYGQSQERFDAAAIE